MNGELSETIKHIAKAAAIFSEWMNAFGPFKKSTRKGKWRMTNKNGQNTKERARNKSMLRGRGCRAHKGRYPSRGKGTTSRSR